LLLKVQGVLLFGIFFLNDFFFFFIHFPLSLKRDEEKQMQRKTIHLVQTSNVLEITGKSRDDVVYRHLDIIRDICITRAVELSCRPCASSIFLWFWFLMFNSKISGCTTLMDSWHGVLIHMELLRREINADETLSFLPKKTIHVHQLDGCSWFMDAT
jgi:hypothetical protein